MSATGLLLEATLKTSIVVLIALCAHSLLRRQSAAFRHWILASAIFCVALAPVLAPLLPTWHISIYTAPATAWIDRQTQSQDARTAAAETLRREPARDGAHTSADSAPPAGRWAVVTSMASQSIAVVWIAGVGISLLILGAGLGRLMSIASRARPVTAGPWFESAARIAHAYGLQRTVQLLQTDHPTLLVTWGAVRPKVMLPRAAQLWSADRIHVVLAHELAHIKRSDWAIHMTGELVRAVYWFNPLVWVACTRLRQESEHATDDAVLNQGVTGSDYAGHLLNLARALSESRRIWLPAPAIARPSSLERRVHAMLNDRKNRAPATRIARLMTFAVVSCL